MAILTIVNSDNRALEVVSDEELFFLRRGASASSSAPYSYALLGAHTLAVYPTPGSSGTLTAYYVPKPTEMSAGAHDPSATTYGNIPVEYHPLLEYWALWRMASYDDDASSGVGATYRQLFDQGIKEARSALRRRGGRKLGPARVGPRRRRPSDPSADVYWG